MMHVIPQSWSHVHILISVFPSFGLLFVLGFYIAGLANNNDGIKRTCLFLFGALAVLSVPIYLSGDASSMVLSDNPLISKATINTHRTWGIGALAVLVATGALAWIELLRTWQAGARIDPFRLVLLLAIAALVVSAVVDEFGWEINHRELKIAVVIPEVSTSQLWTNAHLILNHVPTAGFVFAIFFLVMALLMNNEGMKRGSLTFFVILGVIGVPTYVTGTATMWAVTQPVIPEISKAVINAHRDMALLALVGLAVTGAVAWLELWRSRHFGRVSGVSLITVLLFALVTLGVMTETGHRGGLINHPEIRNALDVLPTDPDAGISTFMESTMKSMIWFVPWQVVHFFGYCLIFGAAFAVVLRVLGVWKSISFAAMHRLLVLGFFGVLMNVVSGMLLMLADSYHYVVGDIAFAPKIALIVIGAIAVLYFSVSDRLWMVKAGEDAPASAKWVAAVVLLAWAGVIVCGRMLPYL
jgi:hypothetical protein